MTSIDLTPITTNPQTTNYTALKPIMEALRSSMDKNPKNSLPTETSGTIQENTHLLPPVTIYTEHGKIRPQKKPGTLIGMA